MSGVNLLATPRGRRVLFTALYFSEGAPVGFVWWALPAMLRTEGVDVGTITRMTSLLVLPWGIKFLWAPFVDVLRWRNWGLRSWIISMQIGMGAVLLPLAFTSIKGQLGLVTTLLVVHAFLAATQDVAVDALCISQVPEKERGRMNGWMQVGYLGGRAIFGGLALVASQWLGLKGLIVALIVAVWSTPLLLLISQEMEPATTSSPAERWARYRPLALRAAMSPVTWLGLGFALIAGCGFEAVGAVASPLLIDVGLKSEHVGYFFVVFPLLGALAGGRLADKFGHRGVVNWLVIGMALVIGAIAALLSMNLVTMSVLIVLLGLLYVMIGAFTAASYALFMDLTEKDLGATQFSAFMGATNFCEAGSARGVGLLQGSYGYGPAFGIMAAVSLISLPLLRLLKIRAGDVTARSENSPPL